LTLDTKIFNRNLIFDRTPSVLTFLLVPHSLLQEHVPVIAVLGSGGGERAVVGLLGSLAQMAEKKLLDSITYLCGVSGSTWCMASLYEDPCWSLKVPTNKDKLMERLSDGEFNISEMLDWLNEAVEDENYSLTDFWAATVVYRTVKKVSDLKKKQLAVVFFICVYKIQGNPSFFSTAIDEFPHEAGYTHVGAYVTTSLFGSQFEEGIVKKQTEEKDMLYLQGLCGSALADVENNKTEIEKWLWNWIKTAKIITKTIVALCSWTWGTKFNFLHNYSVEGKFACVCVCSSDEKRYLMDAGLLLNSPYVAALRPERKVDLILSFDFSSDDPFQTIRQAADYCKEAGVPFPTVVIPAGEEDKPKDFYVFKDGEKAPIVIHIPLFNTVSCGDNLEEWRNNYKTFQLPYDRKKIEEVLSISSLNVKNNKQQIIAEIQAVCTD
uniref:PLA2c domain-containing protein n=1 Tax=Scleropages formosus TaxID=113540 RepID=A0A8C9W3L1_SCLFO